MILKDPIWFAPLNVIHHFAELRNRLPTEKHKTKNFRKAEEMNAVAIMLTGLQLLQKRKYWMQLVGDNEGSPDVRTGTFVPPTKTAADDFSLQDVEVVTYGKYSPESFLNFLKGTKLSTKKSYDSQTMILCVVQRDVLIPPFEKCKSAIQQMSVNCPVMIVGQTSKDEDKYKIAQIYPEIELELEFVLGKTLKENAHTGVLNLQWGTKPKSEYRPEEKHFPFEKLEF